MNTVKSRKRPTPRRDVWLNPDLFYEGVDIVGPRLGYSSTTTAPTRFARSRAEFRILPQSGLYTSDASIVNKTDREMRVIIEV